MQLRRLVSLRGGTLSLSCAETLYVPGCHLFLRCVEVGNASQGMWFNLDWTLAYDERAITDTLVLILRQLRSVALPWPATGGAK